MPGARVWQRGASSIALRVVVVRIAAKMWDTSHALNLLSIFHKANGSNATGVYAVKITGTSLPEKGLVLARSSVCGTGDSMTIYSGDGTLPDVNGQTSRHLPQQNQHNRLAICGSGHR